MIDNLFHRHEVGFLIRPISYFFVSFLVFIMITCDKMYNAAITHLTEIMDIF